MPNQLNSNQTWEGGGKEPGMSNPASFDTPVSITWRNPRKGRRKEQGEKVDLNGVWR